MFSGALLDVSGKKAFLLRELKKLNLPNYRVTVKSVRKNGIRATKFDVIAGHEHAHRHLSDINAMIDGSALGDDVKSLAKQIFLTLGKAEAKAHNVAIEKVHFHEVGAIDSIVDIVSAAILIKTLDIRSVSYDVLTEGRGTVKIDHGEVELPVPAVRHLLEGFPLTIINVPSEMITPTGAAILLTMQAEHVDATELPAGKKGVGAGTKTFKHPNVLRATLTAEPAREKKVLIEMNIDDMNPELFPYVIERCMELGAVEANVQSCLMKKNRIGFLLSVLCDESCKQAVVDMLFAETTTFGLRIRPVRRVMLDRAFKTVRTTNGNMKVKVGKRNGKTVTVKVEYEEAKKLARKTGLPLRQIYADTLSQLENLSKKK